MPSRPNWFSSGYLGPGSSGIWSNAGSFGVPGGIRPNFGAPGDLGRIAGGYEPLDPAMRRFSPNIPANNPNANQPALNFNFHMGQGGPQSAQPSTVSSTKNPIIQGAINSGLSTLSGGNSNLNPGGGGNNANPYTLQSNTRNPALQAALSGMLTNTQNFSNPRDFTRSGQYQQGINSGFQQAAADQGANRNQFSQFADLFGQQTPGVSNNVGQENNAIGQWYNGGVANQLATNAADWTRASRALTDQAMQRVMKNNSIGQMTQGNGSYLTQQALDASGRLAAQQAQQEAELGRNNLLTVLQGQGQYGGVRNRNLDYLSNRQLVPIQALQQLGSYEDARLGGLGGMDLQNNLYTTPAEQAQQRAMMLSQLSNLDSSNNVYTLDNPQTGPARRAALLAQLQGIDQSNNFYGLTKPYQQDNSGYFYQPQFNTQGPRNNFSNYGPTPSVYTPPTSQPSSRYWMPNDTTYPTYG